MKRFSSSVVIAVLAATCCVSMGIGPTPAVAVAATSWDPSGQPMPVGDIAGWHQIFADNFAKEAFPIGSFSGCNLSGCSGLPSTPWGAAVDGQSDTSGHCEYYPSKTVSVAGGIMSISMHTGSNGICMDASLYPLVPSLTYGMYSIRFRSAAVPGYKGIAFLWPVNKHSGEIDFPEANLDAPLHGFLHRIAGGSEQQVFKSTASWTSWHTATLQWTPTSVTFVLDGTTLGTTDINVPQTPMTLAIRAESELLGAPKPPASAEGKLQIDWVTVYSYVPSSAARQA